MELTGIKTPVGLKIQGPTSKAFSSSARRSSRFWSTLPQVRSVFAERVSQGFYVNVDVNRARSRPLRADRRRRAARRCLRHRRRKHRRERRRARTLSRSMCATSATFADDLDRAAPRADRDPFGRADSARQVASVSFSHGPAMIRDEDGALTGYVYLDLNTKDYGGFVTDATRLLGATAQAARRLYLSVVRRI